MTTQPASVLHLLQLTALRCASLLVPGRMRGEGWSELWHVRQALTPLRRLFLIGSTPASAAGSLDAYDRAFRRTLAAFSGQLGFGGAVGDRQ